MAETIVSPGVLTRENDQSQITSQPVVVGAALLGPTVKGKPNIPTIVTSYSDYQSKFGSTFISGSGTGAVEKTFLTSIAAQNYFANGGETLAITRIVSRSSDFSPATSSFITSPAESGVLNTPITATSSLSINAFNITSSAGNGPGTEQKAIQDGSGNGTGLQLTASFSTSESISTITLNGGTGFVVGETVTFTSQSLGSNKGGGTDLIITISAANIINSEPFVLETLSEGTILNSDSTLGTNGVLPNGTEDNFRWQIANSNTTNGTFTLIIRRGDDTTTSPSVLETFTNLSLDPRSPNYISKQIGNQVQTIRGTGTDIYLQSTGSFRNASRYVRVKEVKLNTPDYLDNNGVAKAQFTSSIPTNQSGTFGAATGEIYEGADTLYDQINSTKTQGLVGESYTDAINLHANKDDFRFNVISAPGLYYEGYPTQVNRLIEVCENRGDAIAVTDLVAYGSTLTNVTTQAGNIDSSYVATYWPWVEVQVPDLVGAYEFIPASTLIPGVYAFTDNVSEPWFAPAGINRGGLGSVTQAERKLTQLNRDDLYTNKVNPLATFPGRGVVVFGQKTLQTRATALDRVNVRRLLIALKSFIGQVADNLVFEQNTAATRNNFLSQVNPYLESVQQRQGLFAFNIVMDDSNNTPDVIDRNQLVGQIFVQPTRTAEFIILDFNILPTGAEFSA
jgi:phage tail sheath protein FI